MGFYFIIIVFIYIFSPLNASYFAYGVIEIALSFICLNLIVLRRTIRDFNNPNGVSLFIVNFSNVKPFLEMAEDRTGTTYRFALHLAQEGIYSTNENLDLRSFTYRWSSYQHYLSTL